MRILDIRDALRNEIAIQMQGISNKLSSGVAGDYSTYKQLVGRIQGLRDSLEAVDKVFKHFLEDEE